MVTRDRWLDEGLAVLAEQGAAGVRVDRVAARLGVTKGSFHHHFDGAEDYRRALLHRHEREQTAELGRDLAEAPPETVFATLAERALALLGTGLERAVRAWSATDPAARAVQERLDAARLEFLRELWTRALGAPERARTAALLPHLVVAGIGVVHPRPSEAEVRAVFELLAALAPNVAPPT
jgi:AcrR family transcriptional regulator